MYNTIAPSTPDGNAAWTIHRQLRIKSPRVETAIIKLRDDRDLETLDSARCLEINCYSTNRFLSSARDLDSDVPRLSNVL
jgi:hypothetical protein